MEINVGAETAGLYTMEAAKCDRDSSKDSGESDFSGDFDEKPSKKEGKLGSKKKEDRDKEKKKDKDKGYAALEGESSQEETEMDIKSPFKGKKRSFKFSSGRKEKKKDEEKDKKKDKEKKEKNKDGDFTVKENRDESKVEKADKKKEKKDKDPKAKETKNKLKPKEKKKSKSEEPTEGDELPVFGVPLELAIQRSRCHDGIDLPVVVRNCIDHIEMYGLNQEGIYRSSGIKTRVLELRRSYNNRENVQLDDVDVPTVASLLKQYLRELPENILTAELLPRFDEVSAVKDNHQQQELLHELLDQLPVYNRILLSWVMVHMEHVIERERQNKMNIQNISIVLSPTLNLSHRVLNSFFTHRRSLFSQTKIIPYKPPLSGFGVQLPEDAVGMAAELKKQESLLMQIHGEMSVGSVAKHREEQLWEAQRIVTQLRRQLKLHVQSPAQMAEKAASTQNSVPCQGENAVSNADEELRLELAIPDPVAESVPTQEAITTDVPKDPVPNEPTTATNTAEEDGNVLRVQINANDPDSSKIADPEPDTSHHVTVIEIGPKAAEAEVVPVEKVDPETKTVTESSADDVAKELELKLIIENEEREKLIQQFQESIDKERASIEALQEMIAETGTLRLTDSSEEDETPEIGEEEQEQLLAEILRENRELEEKNAILLSKLEHTREYCLQLRVQLRLREEKHKLGPVPV